MDQIFDICPSFCVTLLHYITFKIYYCRAYNRQSPAMHYDYEPQSHTGLIFQFANAFAIAITFARWWQRSEESTAVPYGANFSLYFLFVCEWRWAAYQWWWHSCIIQDEIASEFVGRFRWGLHLLSGKKSTFQWMEQIWNECPRKILKYEKMGAKFLHTTLAI